MSKENVDGYMTVLLLVEGVGSGFLVEPTFSDNSDLASGNLCPFLC